MADRCLMCKNSDSKAESCSTNSYTQIGLPHIRKLASDEKNGRTISSAPRKRMLSFSVPCKSVVQ